eukprot:scaffold81640_cov19-Tisochrysis_lutea.AAC.1
MDERLKSAGCLLDESVLSHLFYVAGNPANDGQGTEREADKPTGTKGQKALNARHGLQGIEGQKTLNDGQGTEGQKALNARHGMQGIEGQKTLNDGQGTVDVSLTNLLVRTQAKLWQSRARLAQAQNTPGYGALFRVFQKLGLAQKRSQ